MQWNGIIAEQMMKACNNYDYDVGDDYYGNGIINWPIISIMNPKCDQ